MSCILLIAFVGLCIDCKNMRGMGNIKLVYQYSITFLIGDWDTDWLVKETNL